MDKLLFLQEFADYWCKLTDMPLALETPNYPALYLREMLNDTRITLKYKMQVTWTMCMADTVVLGSLTHYCKMKNVDTSKFLVEYNESLTVPFKD